MDHSPLSKKILTPFLDTSRLDDTLLITAGRELINFAVPETHEPRSAGYDNPETAWQNPQPLRVPPNVNTNHPTSVNTAVREAEERKRRPNEVQDAGPNGIDGVESDVSICSFSLT
jgi:hypothetical protein